MTYLVKNKRNQPFRNIVDQVSGVPVLKEIPAKGKIEFQSRTQQLQELERRGDVVVTEQN